MSEQRTRYAVAHDMIVYRTLALAVSEDTPRTVRLLDATTGETIAGVTACHLARDAAGKVSATFTITDIDMRYPHGLLPAQQQIAALMGGEV